MKDFTTPEYINPIIDEIMNEYTPETSAYITEHYRCIAIMNRNNTNLGFILKPWDKYPFEGHDYINHCDKVNDLYNDICLFAEAVETYKGELDFWTYHEMKRVNKAINERLIKRIQEAKTA